MPTPKKPQRRAILVFVQNRQGVLNKIAMLIRRKMYNVETITACRTHLRPEISRLTITLREDRDDKMKQVIKQIEKVTEVISAKELDTDQSYWREVAMVKTEADKTHMESLGTKYHFDILHHLGHSLKEHCQKEHDQKEYGRKEHGRKEHGRYIIQIAGTSKEIDDFLHELGREKIVEVARSGFTAIEK